MPHIITSPPNAIIFVFDPNNTTAVIPDYINGSLVAANGTCVSVGTQPDIDGPTTIYLKKGLVEYGSLVEVFRGHIQSPSGKIAVCSALNERLLEIETDPGLAAISVLVDDMRAPSSVSVCVGGVAE